MTKLKQIYRCNVCGNIVEVVGEGKGKMVCCGEEMELLTEQDISKENKEKHVPVIEKTNNGVKVKVGSVEHPMQDEHYIEWIEIEYDDKVERKFLKPGDKPEAEFDVNYDGEIKARAYCNLHGLWKSE